MLTAARRSPARPCRTPSARSSRRSPTGLAAGENAPRVRELLARCIQKDPNRRLRDVGDARIELDDSISVRLSSCRRRVAPASRRSIGRRASPRLPVPRRSRSRATCLNARRPAGTPSSGRQLAVLPFRNLTERAGGRAPGARHGRRPSASGSPTFPGLQVVTPRAAVESRRERPELRTRRPTLGANTLLAGTFQRENERYRITYRLVDAKGQQLAADAIDGSELFDSGPRRRRRGAGPQLRRGARRTPTPSGLDTVADQERYLQAIGLLHRYDKREGVERAMQILSRLAEEKPQSALVQAALGRAGLAMYDFTKDRTWADRAVAASDAARVLDPNLPEVDVIARRDVPRHGAAREAADAFRHALAASPDKVDALLGLGRASEDRGTISTAEKAFERAANAAAVLRRVQPARRSCTPHRGRWLAAAAVPASDRRRSRQLPRLQQPRRRLVGVATFRGRIPLRRALELRPADPIAASNLGLTLLWTGRPPRPSYARDRPRNAPNDPGAGRRRRPDGKGATSAPPRPTDARSSWRERPCA